MDVDTRTTDHKFVGQWRLAQERVKAARSELNAAECGLANAATALGKQLAPADAKAGETFSIWHDAELIVVSVVGYGDYKVSVRPGKRAAA